LCGDELESVVRHGCRGFRVSTTKFAAPIPRWFRRLTLQRYCEILKCARIIF
jgi:hypothetical protein